MKLISKKDKHLDKLVVVVSDQKAVMSVPPQVYSYSLHPGMVRTAILTQVQCSAVQYSAVQCSTVQCSTVQCSARNLLNAHCRVCSACRMAVL